MKGIRIIAGALAIFDKIVAKLMKGIEICEAEVLVKSDIMAQTERDKMILDTNIEKAKKAITNIEKLTS